MKRAESYEEFKALMETEAVCLTEPGKADEWRRRYEQETRKYTDAGLKDEPALRYDAYKSRLDLIDPGFLLRLGDHYEVGAKKYAERNWQKGMSFSRCYASAMRHMLAFWSGEDFDAETGSSHVIAAAWNMAAIDYYMNDPELREKFDDRP